MRASKILLGGLVLVALMPAAAFAGGPHDINWGKAIYPYKDLPGVTAPQLPEEKFKCSTTVAEAPFDFYGYGHAYPRLVYVCDQNGVISESTRPPNYSYWQYNNRNH